jgi:hypothetical protein
MEDKVNELESKITSELSAFPDSGDDSRIIELTRELITEGESVLHGVSIYNHNVCHLFEGFGRGQPSYLDSTATLPIAGELVNYALGKAAASGDFGCTGRIISPIIDLNLIGLEDTLDGFTFKPEIFSDANFIETISSSSEAEYISSLINFCKSGSMGEFFPRFVQGLRAKEGLEKLADTSEVSPGVFIDVDGTLVSRSYDTNKHESVYEKLASTQEYALGKLSEGLPVTVFTGGDPAEAIKNLISAEVDERLLDVRSKHDYIGRILEICVDDTAPAMQGFRAKTHYKSGEIALDTERSA